MVWMGGEGGPRGQTYKIFEKLRLRFFGDSSSFEDGYKVFVYLSLAAQHGNFDSAFLLEIR